VYLWVKITSQAAFMIFESDLMLSQLDFEFLRFTIGEMTFWVMRPLKGRH
jgi:hypothetical protein